jgi:dihydroorotate dehydrogenase (NAD+) catalytic subunit
VSRQKVGPDRAIIGINGARTGLDVARMMLAGASAVELASQVMLRGTPVLTSALAEFEAYLQRKGLNAAEIVGVAADQRKAFPDMPLRTNNWRNYISEL